MVYHPGEVGMSQIKKPCLARWWEWGLSSGKTPLSSSQVSSVYGRAQNPVFIVFPISVNLCLIPYDKLAGEIGTHLSIVLNKGGKE